MAWILIWGVSYLWLRAFPTVCSAQIHTDGSLGKVEKLSSPDHVIPAQVGRLERANLFHSFGVFKVPTGGSATFQGPMAIENIVGRVTGGEVSMINGKLRLEMPGASLYLLNPQGIVMGADARLDVGGSFDMSTAQELHFEDGIMFQATSTSGSVLSTAAPSRLCKLPGA